jgi:nicotinamidase-related amidase
MRLNVEKCIGLVIDIQEKLLPAMGERDSFLTSAVKLIQGLNALSVPILVTQQYTKGLGDTVPEVANLFEQFEYTEKKAFSCFDEPVFATNLSVSGKTMVIICGIESHVCVLQTAVDLKQAGYFPVVVADAISSRTSKSVEMALERFRFEGIMFTTCESVLFELTRSADNPNFKAISKIIK